MKIELTLNEGMNVAKAFRDTAIAKGWAEAGIQPVIEEYAAAFDAAMKAIGIELVVNPTVVENEEEFDMDDFSEEEIQPTPTVKDDFIYRYVEAGHSLDEALEVADILFGEEEDE